MSEETSPAIPRYQIKSLSHVDKIIAYIVYDYMTRDEWQTFTVTPEIPADVALQQAIDRCAELNNESETTK